MEYLEGETLADRLAKRGALPLEQALRYGIEIADALDKAHRQGIVHRDLKPGNVMLTKSGVKLLDFGLAKALAPVVLGVGADRAGRRSRPLTESGTILGTVPVHGARSSSRGERPTRAPTSSRSALVLYEMATGKKAFSGATQASLIGAILRDEPPPVSQQQPLAPLALDRLVADLSRQGPRRPLAERRRPEARAPVDRRGSEGHERGRRGAALLGREGIASGWRGFSSRCSWRGWRRSRRCARDPRLLRAAPFVSSFRFPAARPSRRGRSPGARRSLPTGRGSPSRRFGKDAAVSSCDRSTPRTPSSSRAPSMQRRTSGRQTGASSLFSPAASCARSRPPADLQRISATPTSRSWARGTAMARSSSRSSCHPGSTAFPIKAESPSG